VPAFDTRGNGMTKFAFRIVLALTSVLAVPVAFAEGTAPDLLLSSITAEVTAIIREDAAIQAGNRAKVGDLVETRILPHFDFARMTQIAVARNWHVATAEQRQLLTSEFAPIPLPCRPIATR
jgi:phospholipid transport system substrate-binding protein